MFSRSSVTDTWVHLTSSSPRMSHSRSWVIGRGVPGALELHQDRGRLRMADPDRQELVAVDGLQEHDRLLANHVEADAVDDHLLHEDPPGGVKSEYRFKAGAPTGPGALPTAFGGALTGALPPEAPELVAQEVQRHRARRRRAPGRAPCRAPAASTSTVSSSRLRTSASRLTTRKRTAWACARPRARRRSSGG